MSRDADAQALAVVIAALVRRGEAAHTRMTHVAEDAARCLHLAEEHLIALRAQSMNERFGPKPEEPK
jgi:hypothetical protein